MTLQFCDGFDTGDFLAKWSSQSISGSGGAQTASTDTPFGAGKSLSFAATTAGSSNVNRLNQTIPAAGTFYLGFAFKVQARPVGGSSDGPILKLFGDAGATEHLRLNVPISGTPNWTRAGLASLGALTTSIVVGQWYYLEAKITISDTVGEITTHIDGNADTSLTSIDTKNAGTNSSIDTIAIGNWAGGASTSGAGVLFDDLYVCNTAGAVNNSFLGPIRIQTLSPNAAGTDTGLTPVGASNYQNVSDQNVSTYNYSSTTGTRDSYALPDLAAGTSAVLAVKNVLAGQTSDAGAGAFKPVVRSAGTNYYDTTATLGATNKVYSQAIRETDPATSAAWTIAAVNALQVGAEVA
jgi:hypothetical protein